jgi:hypothetical protein
MANDAECQHGPLYTRPMADQIRAVETPAHIPGQNDDAEALRAELAERQEEVLRLRDLLIARDAELGAAKGRLAELEQQSRYLTVVASRLQAGPRGIIELARAALAKLLRRG